LATEAPIEIPNTTPTETPTTTPTPTSTSTPTPTVAPIDEGALIMEHLDAFRLDYASTYDSRLNERQHEVSIIDGQVTLAGIALTQTDDVKKLPVLSPDGRRICYVSQNIDSPRHDIAIIDIETGRTAYYNQEEMHGTLYVEWLDNGRVAVTNHVNPSLNTYNVLDVKTGEVTFYYGLSFIWDTAMENLYYVKARPHFGLGGTDKIMRNADEEILFDAGEGVRLTSGLGINADGSEFYSFSRSEESGKVYLNISSGLGDSAEVLSIPWDGVTGRIFPSSDGKIIVESEYKAITFDRQLEQITEIVVK
jgi:hypothetical protein